MGNRWLLRFLMALLVVPVLLYGVGPLRHQEEWRRIAQPYKFSVVGWEARNLWDKWAFRLREPWQGSLSEGEKRARVEEYFALASQIGEAEGQLLQARAAQGPGPEVAALEERLNRLREGRGRLEGRVEETLEAQLSQAAQGEGITMALDLGFRLDYLFPPVDLAFESLLHLLVISPREAIETRDTVVLEPGLTLARIEAMEARVEGLGVSAYVTPIGGLATYPSHIPETSSLEGALATAAHEWLHHYLYFKPLGQNYARDQDLRTINETAADMAGRELASKMLVRYYGRPPLPLRPVGAPPSEPVSEDVFDFNREMRRIRLEVDRLLGLGQVEAAEQYMEERRRFLTAQGHPLRKLNQAYFAFHGTYATSPASVSPIGGQLIELRRRFGSLGEFVRTVAGLTSYQDLLSLLEKAREGQDP